jgi:hypothetical protein
MIPRFSAHLVSIAMFLVGAMLFGHAGQAQLYDNGAPGHSTALQISEYVQADDVPLSYGARLQSVRFWTFEALADFQGSFTWEIFADSPTHTPGVLLLSGTSANLNRVITGISVEIYLEVMNTFDLPSINLAPGRYWFALHNGPLANNSAKKVFWENTDANGTMDSQADYKPFTGAWDSNNCPECTENPPREFAFQLFGVSAPRVTAVTFQPPSFPRINFTTVSGQSYRVEYKNQITDTFWTTLPGAEMISGDGGVVQITDTTASGRSRRFYRAILL